MSRPRLEQLEQLGQPPAGLAPLVAWLVLDEVPVPDAELRPALRRAVLVLAAGGDPTRELSLDDVAVERLAEELDAPDRRAALAAALDALAADAIGLPTVEEALAALRADPELAWRAFALAAIADDLADEEGD